MDQCFTGISLIIPFYDDIDQVYKCLAAIHSALTNLSIEDRQNVEIILIDDASPRAFPRDDSPVPLICHRMKKRAGAGAARNKGGELAQYSHLFFIDSDVVLDDEYLRHVVHVLKYQKIKILQGAISAEPANEMPSLFHYYMAISWNLFLNNEQWPSLLTLCVVFEKSFFTLIGGFSEDYNDSGGEEFEIMDRLWLLDRKSVTFDPSLIFYHHYDNFFVRIGKVFSRSKRYVDVLGRNKMLPFFFKVQSGIRIFFSLFLSLTLLYGVFDPFGAAVAYLIIGRMFLGIDWELSLHFWQRHSWKLAFASVFFRQMEYLAVIGGIVCGLIKKDTAR